MARVQYGAIVTELKGKIGGQVFQKGNGASVLRNKGYARGSSTTRRSAAVSQVVSIASLYRSLTTTQYNSWVALAVTWPFTDKFGVVYYSNAYQVFVACNTALVSLGESTLLTAPAAVANEAVTVNTLECTSPDELIITTAGTTTANMVLQVYAAAPTSAGVHRTNLRYKLLGQLVASAATIIDLGAEYVAAWGEMQAGAKIACKFVARNTDYPLVYSTSYKSAIVLP